MIEIENLSKEFTLKDGTLLKAVDNVNMSVSKSELCVLLGTSGSGKTTTLKMINRLTDLTSGKIMINGVDNMSLNPVELRRSIGYVFQKIGLFPNMTVEENISIVPNITKMDKKKTKKRVVELLDIFTLPTSKNFLRKFPYQLSGGQAQRVGVARALASDPDILLMDEPFGAVDPINRTIMQDEFLKIQKELKKSVLFVSHDVDEAVRIADKIAIFSKGKIVQFDYTDNILYKPKNDFIEEFIGIDSITTKIFQIHTVKETIQKSDEYNDVFVKGDTSLLEASSLLYKEGVEFLTCIDEDEKPIGTITHKAISTFINKYKPQNADKK